MGVEVEDQAWFRHAFAALTAVFNGPVP